MSSLGSGAGSALNPVLLSCAGTATLMATLISFGSIYLHLKNYRKNVLQRMVVRIMIMIPVYGISSFVSLHSLHAAFVIDAIRDVYEAFVIYVFFQLLIAYLGGERSLLILLHGRPPVHPLFPVNLFVRDFDASDPYTYLWLKRGILQYVQVKPILAVATIVSKVFGKYDEGDLKAGSGYLYISIIYNVSIAVALYCLAMFWVVVHADLRPFRPIPKFLCVKGILFFSFWQSFFISILVAAGVVRSLGPYKDPSKISTAITDLLICLEMPLFAIAHMYAFSHTDYIDSNQQYCARMPLRYAFRDAFGLKDVIEDSKATLRGEGMEYRAFEPAEGKIHQGSGRNRRIRAGLRYARGGKHKYWLPMPAPDASVDVGTKRGGSRGKMDIVRNRLIGGDEDSHAPLLEDQGRDAIHVAPDLRNNSDSEDGDYHSDGFSLTYSDPHASDDEMYALSRDYLFGDYNYPCIDVSSEAARRSMWEEEERVLRDERAAFYSPSLGHQARLLANQRINYGATVQSSVSESELAGRRKLKGKEDGYQTRPVPRTDIEQVRGKAVIDMESNRLPDSETGGLRMQWTKGERSSPKRKKQFARSPQDRVDGYNSLPPDPDSSQQSVRIPPRPQRERLSSRAELPQLSHDAVDLVVEDKEAWEDRVSRERRKGEPALGQAGDAKALRKVYTPGYAADHQEGQGSGGAEAVIGGQATDGQEDQGQRRVSVRAAEREYDRKGGRLMGEAGTVDVVDPTVARAATPPEHIRVDAVPDRTPKILTDREDNPWL